MEFLSLFFLKELLLHCVYNHCLMVLNAIGWEINNVLFSRVAESKETLVTPRSRGDSGKPLVDSRASACRYSRPAHLYKIVDWVSDVEPNLHWLLNDV